MAIKAVLFDLDGTLLPMDQDAFVKIYFSAMAQRMAPYGYDPKQLIDGIWAGTAAMVRNDGSRTNEDVFWDVFTQCCGEEVRQHKPIIDAFYSNEFIKAKAACGFQPMAKEAVELARVGGRQVVLATNPIFPAVATENRMRWAGLEPGDFDHYTTYENTGTGKPNPAYYAEVLEQIGRKPEECLMVGNDVGEDMVAETLGMRVFLLTDCLINRKEQDISRYDRGGFPELIAYLKQM